MHSPEEHTNAVLRTLGKLKIPHHEFPIERPTFAPKRCAEQIAVGPITRRHKSLQMMTRYELVEYSRARKMHVVAAHAHHFLLVTHAVRGEGNLYHFTPEKERAYKLSFGRHHLHAPRVASKLRYGHQIVIVNELDCFDCEIAD